MDKLKEIINEILDNSERETIKNIRDDMSLTDDIGFDSLDLAELTVHVEKVFGIDIFEDGFVESIGDIRKKIGI